jgi:hypothetical protein
MLNDGVSGMCHYLDGMFTCGVKDTYECMSNLTTMLNVCSDCGVLINPAKLVGPVDCIEFLGIIVDSVKMELSISDVRLEGVKKELVKWVDTRSGTKRALLSLLGKLVFLTRIISPGRIFMRRLLNLSMGVKHLHYKVKLNRDAKEDVVWWLNCIDRWNHKSVFMEEE